MAQRRVIVLALTAAAAISLSAQQAPQQPTFRSGVDAVTVDAIVTDSQGRHVTDLTKDDFEIKENGKLQTVQSFRRFTIDDVPPGRLTVPINSLNVMEREAARDDVRLIAIFLDDYHTRMGNAMAIRQKIAAFVKQLDSRDMVAVMYPLTPSTGLTFSRDHDGTASAIMKFEGRKYDYLIRYPQEEVYARLTPGQIERLRNQIVMGALQGLCSVLGSFRDGRKTIVMVSEGLMGLSTMDDDLRFQLRELATTAARSTTSIYPLDPRGLAVFETDISRPAPLNMDRAMLRDLTDFLRVVADETDGRAIVDTNDPMPLLKQMLVDTSAYYLLGYTSTEAPRDGKFHPISVSVKRKGVEIRARKGYWAYSAEDVARASAPARPELPRDMAIALAGAAPAPRGRALRTWIGFDRVDSGPETVVTLVWELAPASAGADTSGQVSIQATAGNELLYRGRSPQGAGASATSGRVTFKSRPGPVHLRAAAQDASGQPLDTEERDVDVPDFTSPGPRISTPAVFRARSARELAQIRLSPDALPTATQQFSRDEQMLLRFSTYGPPGPMLTVSVRVRNSQGDTIRTLTTGQAPPSGTFQIPLQLGGLAPGSYLIEVEAASGAETSRVYWGFAIKG